MSINLLDKNTINKIAAGEVVDRPSSVVKELVENAIDAGANAITVEIKEGGISLIRVTDNGCGIAKEDIKIAFLRHSTSKIKDAADLASISSLGFRGEALSSICAVSQVELITKKKEDLTGSRYEIEGSMEKTLEEVGAPEGTTFIVRNLFYNTPARRKFLKTAPTEAGYISTLMEHLSMSHPDISFRLIQNNQPKLQTVGNGNLKDVIYAIYGREIAQNLLEVHAEDAGHVFSITGFIGKPVISRGNRGFENYYINGRYIKSNLVMKAIEDAYAPFIMQHKYPFTAFHISIAPEFLDVNVHPSKMELRFADGQYIYEQVMNAVRNALKQKELIPDVTLTDVKSPEKINPVPHQNVSATQADAAVPKETADKNVIEINHTEKNYAEKNHAEKNHAEKTPVIPPRMPEPFETKRTAVYEEIIRKEEEAQRQTAQKQMTLFEQPELLEKQNEKDIRIIGQVFDTYWIIQFEKSMYIIDQHAAHEKVLFERFMRAYQDRKITTQQISPPVIFSLTLAEQDVLEENLALFTDYGFEIEAFGGEEYALRGIPADFTQAKPEELLLEILDDLLDDRNNRRNPESIKDRIATMSCKAAVKGNNRLSYPEVKTLIHDLMDLENPYHCPHGRPTMISLSQYELEKKFKRIL